MVGVFERPLLQGQSYPCSKKDILKRLSSVAPNDLEGLWAIGLVSSTRKDSNANGRYLPGMKPVIHLMSYPETLSYKLSPHIKKIDIVAGLAVEIRFGMQFHQSGSRWICSWDKESLRNFTLEHVLLHEIGHHVQYLERRLNGNISLPTRHVREQFAEAYALRHERPKA